MKRNYLPLCGMLLSIVLLVVGLRLNSGYVMPWEREGTRLTSMVELLVRPAVARLLRRGGASLSPEGTGRLVNELAFSMQGDVGEGLDFPERFYPYRAMLNENQKAVYNQAYTNALALETETFLLVRPLSEAELRDTMAALYLDQPTLFYLEAGYSYDYMQDGTVQTLQLSYSALADDIDAARAAFDAATERIVAEARQYPTVIEREIFVHDEILELCVYDETAEHHQSAYSALVNGRSVCAGYARAFQHLMHELDIPCYFCEGLSSGVRHGWNIIELADGFYNVDLTSDDSMPGRSHLFFNVSDVLFSLFAVREGLSVQLPLCEGVQYAGT